MRSKIFRKIFQTLLFLTSTLGVAIDVYVNYSESGIWHGLSIFKFFTLQSNTLILIYSFIALFNIAKSSESSCFKKLLSPFTAYIVLTGLTFAVLLAPTSTATGLHKVASDILHYIVPPLMLLYWLIFEERELQYKFILNWLAYPVAFMVWGLFRAFVFSDYLYPFFDIQKFGIFLIIYLLLMAGSTAAIAFVLVFINKRRILPQKN